MESFPPTFMIDLFLLESVVSRINIFVLQGMCHMKLQENRNALFSFEKALQVYPGLKDVRKYLGLLKRRNDERQGGAS